MRRPLILLPILLAATPAHAAETLFGYQLGISQSAGGNATDNPQNFVATATTSVITVGTAPIQRLSGYQFATQGSANVTVDVLTDTIDHGLLFGALFSQLVPVGVPADVLPTLRDQVSTVQATATYAARVVRPTWGIGFGGGYIFASNGRLDQGADGSQTGIGGQGSTLPGLAVGNFIINGRTQTANGQFQLQLTHTTWDLNFNARYNYTQNGVFTLAVGGDPSPDGTVSQPRSAAGAFFPATSHNINPTLVYRHRIGTRNVFTASALYTQIIPVALDGRLVTATGATVPAQALLPETGNITGLLGYQYTLNDLSNAGIQLSAIHTRRVPTTNTATTVMGRMLMPGAPLPGGGLLADTLLLEAEAIFQGRVRALELGIGIQGGIASALLFQQPLGTATTCLTGCGAGSAIFDAPSRVFQPIFAVNLQRRFNPIDVTLSAGQRITTGALGASAIRVQGAALTLRHQLDISQNYNLVTSVGFNLARTRGIGTTLLPTTNADPLLSAATNNDSVGANVALGMPLFRAGDLAFDINATYGYTFADLDPDKQRMRMNPRGMAMGGARTCTMLTPECTGLDPSTTHTGIVSIRGTFGRGPLQQGNRNRELDAFSQDPRSGSPLTTATLTNQGARLLNGTAGTAPGRPPEAPRDSRQAYEVSRKQEDSDRESRRRADLVVGSKTILEEEEDARQAAQKAREARREGRTREFGDAPPPPPPPPPKSDPKAEEELKAKYKAEEAKRKKAAEEKKSSSSEKSPASDEKSE